MDRVDTKSFMWLLKIQSLSRNVCKTPCKLSSNTPYYVVPIVGAHSADVFSIWGEGKGGEGKDRRVLASSEAFLIVILSFLRTVREGSAAPLPRLALCLSAS